MRKIFFIPVIGLFLLCAGTITPAQASTTPIIAFGDSLTEGCDITGSSTCGWVGGWGYWLELQSLIDADGLDYTVYNHGNGGETTSDGVNRIDSVLDRACSQGASHILILEGTNDLLHYRTWQQVLFNLEVMIDKSRARGIEPLLATLTPDPNPEHAYKDIPLMNQKIREFAASKQPQVTLVDLDKALSPYWSQYTNPRGCYGDLLHPNWAGFQAMAATWYATLYEFIKKDVHLPWLMLLLGNP
ncbi:MAG: hypothetical protein Kow0089_00430 [Desulfobulbaceae bacterium]